MNTHEYTQTSSDLNAICIYAIKKTLLKSA